MSKAAMILEAATRTALTTLILFATAPAYAQMVKYTDEQGQTHYVGAPDQVPTKYREKSVDMMHNAPKQTVILPPSKKQEAQSAWGVEDPNAEFYGLYEHKNDADGFKWVKSYETRAECSAAAKALWLSSKHAAGCRAFYAAVPEPLQPTQRGIETSARKDDYRRRIQAGEVVTDRKRVEWDHRQTIFENCLRMASRFGGSVANCSQ